MIDTNLIRDFVSLSQEVGKEVADTQGGGGNVSIKFAEAQMLIKASGVLLKEVDLDKPGVIVNFSKSLDYIHKFFHETHQLSLHESILNKLIDDHSHDNTQRKASIETSMHAVIPKRYIVHTHPVYANVFTCAQEGKALLGSILKDFNWGWCDYAAPGFSLASELFDTFGDGDYPAVIFLKNHGLIVTGDNMQETIALYRHVLVRLQQYIFTHKGGKFSYEPLQWTDANTAQAFLGKLLLPLFQEGQLVTHLFPDSVVFGNDVVTNRDGKFVYSEDGSINLSLTTTCQAQIIYENLLAVHYILAIHHHFGLTTSYLSSNDVSYILGMEREKYRRSLNK